MWVYLNAPRLMLQNHTRFIVRDFHYDENSLEKQRKEAEETISSEREQQQIIIRLAKTNFSEVFSSWLHLKALRIFVESVLRYGLPPDFTAAVIEVRDICFHGISLKACCLH